MALETATYIDSLVTSNPAGGDQASTADDHLRLLKASLQRTFPNITGELSATHTLLNQAALGAITASYAQSADYAASADYATSANHAASALGAVSAVFATSATRATSATFANSCSHAHSANVAVSADRASSAIRAASAVRANSAVFATSALGAVSAQRADSCIRATSADRATSASFANSVRLASVTRPIGPDDLLPLTANASVHINSAGGYDSIFVKTNTTAYAYGIKADTSYTGRVIMLINEGSSGDVTISVSGSITLSNPDGSAVNTGARTLGVGGMATVVKGKGTSKYYIWGNVGLT